MSPRDIALAAALEASARQIPLQDALSGLFAGSGLDRRDRALAEELALGALRRRLALDLVIGRASSRPVERMQPALAEALRQGAYQLLFLDRVPPHAAVNETVELVKARVGRRPADFANAVLRAVARLVSSRSSPRPDDELAPRALAARSGRFVILSEPILDDPRRDLAGWLAGSYGYPAWMVRRWLRRHGPARTERILEWGNAAPALSIRLNRTRIALGGLGQEELARIFEGCRRFERGEVEGVWRVDPEFPPAELPGLAAGFFSIQDETQARPALLLGPAEGSEVLDLCAGLGGKTIQLAELVGASGRVFALDRDPAKLALASEAARRLGLANVTLVEGDVLAPPPELAREWQFVLIDAPCSNMGALDRRPEVRLRASEEALGRLVRTELALLLAAMDRVRRGGSLVYSVCSFEEEETRGVVSSALGARGEFRLVAESLVLPEPAGLDRCAGGRDGGYCARLVRAAGS